MKTKILSILFGVAAIFLLTSSVTISNGDKVTLSDSNSLDIIVSSSVTTGSLLVYVQVISSASGVQFSSNTTIDSDNYAWPTGSKVPITLKINYATSQRILKAKGTNGDIIAITY